MSYYECPKCGNRDEIFKHGGGKKTADLLGVPFLGEVPIDPRVAIQGDAGHADHGVRPGLDGLEGVPAPRRAGGEGRRRLTARAVGA